MKKILITGSSGFIGVPVLRNLVASDCVLRIVVRPESYERMRIQFPGVEVVVSQDIFTERPEKIKQFFQGMDAVLHLAWCATNRDYHSPENVSCLYGTLQLAKSSLECGIRRFVAAGTCAEYEDSEDDLLPSSPLKGKNLYSVSKIAAYLVLSQLFRGSAVEFLWARFFYLYGRGEHPDRLVPYLERRLSAGMPAELSSGNQVRDYLDINDASQQFCKLILSHAQGAFNICSGIPVTIREMAERIADRHGRRDLLRFGVKPERAYDPPRVVGVPTVF